MLPFFAGGNPFAASPEMALASGIGGPQQPPQMPDPQTTGSVTPPAPAPTQAPAAPAAGGGIGDMLANAFSGRGILGGQPGDDVVDPRTGMTPGDRRAGAMQQMMKMGLLFLAAGQNMSNDQRAAILAKAPGLIGDGEGANSFAQSRLQMAKLKLEERKQLMEEQALKDQNTALQTLTGGAPAGAGAGAVAAAQAGNAATGEAIGAPEAAAAANAPQVAQAGPQAAPLPTGPALAPGGVPRGPLLTPADAMGIRAAGADVRSRGQALNQAIQGAQNRERQGAPTFNPVTNKIETPIYNGRGELVRTQVGDTPAPTVREIDGKMVKGYALPNGGFHPTDIQAIAEDPAVAEDRRMQAGIIRDNYKEYRATYNDQIQSGMQRYDKLAKVREDVLNGKGIFGTGAETASSVIKGLASYGVISPKYADDLMTNDNFMRATKDSVADVIRNFNGSQGVSNADREFAAQVVGATLSGTRPQIINALTNNMADIRNNATRYSQNARAHNEQAQALPEGSRKLVTLPTVDRDFDKEETEFGNRFQTWRQNEEAKYNGKQTGAPAAVAPPPQAIDLLKRDPGKYRSFFDQKYGAGAAAKILGN